MNDHGLTEVAARYGPALVAAPLGAINPTYGAIAFGMVAGWFAVAGVMVEQQKTLVEIRRAMIVSVLIGGGGALSAAFAVERLHLSTIEAALVAFTIAFGGVKSIEVLTGTMWKIFEWFVDKLIDDAERAGKERQRAQILIIETEIENRKRLEETTDQMLRRLENLQDDQNSPS